MKVHHPLYNIQPLVPIQQQANTVNVFPSFLFTKYFNIIFTSTLDLASSQFHQGSLPILLCTYTYFSSPPHARPSPTHLPTPLFPWFDHPTNFIKWRLKYMKFLIMLFSLLFFTSPFFYGSKSSVAFSLLTFRKHTTLGRVPLDEWSACRRVLYLTTHNTHNRQTYMPPAGFEPTIPAKERLQTHILDGPTTGIGTYPLLGSNIPTGSYSRKCPVNFWIKNA
jgi:hypothetical protein